MPFTEISGLKVFQFNNLSRIPWLRHGISTRTGGESIGPYKSLNLSLLVGDDKEKVIANRRKFFQALGIKEQDVVDAQQVHGNRVAIIDKTARGKVILQTDALLTQETGVSLLVKVADCPVILLADRKKKVVAIVHAGWRGTLQEITKLAVEHMQDNFGTKPADLVAGIGPSIGSCCYEVDTPVISQFKSRFNYADKLLSKVRGGHAYLDLWKANTFQLIETGIREENIEIASICTYDNPKLFFSERWEGLPAQAGKTGRFGAVIWMRK